MHQYQRYIRPVDDLIVQAAFGWRRKVLDKRTPTIQRGVVVPAQADYSFFVSPIQFLEDMFIA